MFGCSISCVVGFFISDHPLNQFTEIFKDYKIKDYSSFISREDLKDSNIAATLLKVQERKTAPAAPNKCPIEDLVDDIDILLRLASKALSTAFNSISSPFGVEVPCALI